MKKIIKGSCGYLQQKRIQVLVRTILYYGIAIALYILGRVTTKTDKNLLTVVAVLGCLPASKSLVGLIMYLRAKGCSREAQEWLQQEEGSLIGMYDMYFTSYKKNFAVSHMVVTGKNICGYTESKDCDCRACEQHLEEHLKQAGLKDNTIKIFSDEAKYRERLRQLNRLQAETSAEREDEIRLVLYEISL